MPKYENIKFVPYCHPDDPATYLKPGEPLLCEGVDYSWCFVIFGTLERIPGYHIASSGVVWSERTGSGSRGELRKLNLVCSDGRPIFQTTYNQKNRKTHRVCRLVLEVFIGPCPERMECCHNNGNSMDNRLVNLRWDTDAANQEDRIAHGTSNRGSRHGMSRLTETDVLEIRRRHKAGESLTDLSNSFKSKCGYFGIRDIVSRKNWKHLPDEQ